MGLLSDRRPNGLEARKALWIGGAAVFALPESPHKQGLAALARFAVERSA